MEGLDQDQEVPFEFADSTGADPGFQRRESVDAGTDVIDLAAMRDQLEADRRERQEGR
jgi:hypothetical protein